MSQLKSIKAKILANFCITVALIMLAIGAITNWRLDLSIDRQSEVLDKDVVSNNYDTLKGHHDILKTLNNNIQGYALNSAKELSNSPILKTIVDNQMYDAAGDFLTTQFQSTETDFAMILGLEGNLLASYPQVTDKNAVEKTFAQSSVGEDIIKLLSQGGDLTKGASGVSLVSANFLQGSGLGSRALADKGGISFTGALPVMDSFGSPVAIAFTGVILNGHDKLLKQLHNATRSSCSIYMNNLPLAFAGYGEETSNFNIAGITLSNEAVKKIYASEQTINDIVVLAGEPHLAACSPIISSKNKKIGAQCVTYPESKLLKAAEYGSETKTDLQLWFISIGIVSMLIFIVVSIFISKSITQPLMHSIMHLNESGQLVAKEGEEIYSASKTLSDGASQQASSLEETSASLEEMSAMTRQNADNAAQANDLMNEVGDVISTANTSMHELTKSMGEISTASEKTSKIIKTIDEIAFQTNLLALNAAVEAARAGQAGAGFAVVADEVRNLALRAAQAARDTGELIAGTVSKINEGDLTVRKTAEAFSEVTTKTTNATNLVAEITLASQEQAQGIGHLNTGVANIDRVTQENASQAEYAASAAAELNSQADGLKEVSRRLTLLVVGRETIDTLSNDTFESDMQNATQILITENNL